MPGALEALIPLSGWKEIRRTPCSLIIHYFIFKSGISFTLWANIHTSCTELPNLSTITFLYSIVSAQWCMANLFSNLGTGDISITKRSVHIAVSCSKRVSKWFTKLFCLHTMFVSLFFQQLLHAVTVLTSDLTKNVIYKPVKSPGRSWNHPLK